MKIISIYVRSFMYPFSYENNSYLCTIVRIRSIDPITLFPSLKMFSINIEIRVSFFLSLFI